MKRKLPVAMATLKQRSLPTVLETFMKSARAVAVLKR
jgi:hypothetical protein